MFRLRRRPAPETEQIFHEIRQTLRGSGIDPVFRAWAADDEFLRLLWPQLKHNAQARSFEDAAESLRRTASLCAQEMGRMGTDLAHLGESQVYQIRQALKLYSYLAPKILILATATRLALEGKSVGETPPSLQEWMLLGVPAEMYPMELVSDPPTDPRLRKAFKDIQKTLRLERISYPYRTLALWPEYLLPSWNNLKPLIGNEMYARFAKTLQADAERAAEALPFPIQLPLHSKMLARTQRHERHLPALVLNLELLRLDIESVRELASPPFPAEFEEAA